MAKEEKIIFVKNSDLIDIAKRIKRDEKVIILDNNELSILAYAEEYPENWKRICEALDRKQTDNETKQNGEKNA